MTEVTRPHCLVVGGTRGAGRVTARWLADRGSDVTVIARRSEDVDIARHPGIVVVRGDLTEPATLLATLAPILQDRGPLSGLVFMQRYRGGADRSWTGEMETSVTATNLLIEGLIDRFRPSGGSIVAVSSNAAHSVGLDQSSGYHVAKAALEQLVRYHAVALGSRRIRVNAVAPSAIRREDPGCPPGTGAELATLFSRIAPLGRMAAAADVAGAISFLLSDDASFITGQTLVVDGGSSLLRHDQLARQLLESPAGASEMKE